MKFSLLPIILTALLLCPPIVAGASPTDDDQSELRLNPEIANEAAVEIDYSKFPFLNLDQNVINLNGDDWSALAAKFAGAAAGDSLFTVVYLGDSHIQADFGGAVLRQRLTDVGRYAGRGLIIPFKLAGTNEPNDYSITITGDYLSSRLLKTPWSTDMPFTGIAIAPRGHRCTLHVSSPAPTKHVRVLGNHEPMRFRLEHGACDFDLPIACKDGLVIGGLDLRSDSVGTLVHSIGNNGATYSSYATIPRFGSELAQLAPDLVIIALGTNEAFSRIDTATLRDNIEILVETIKRHNPKTKIMLIGPAACYKKVYRSRRRRRRQSTLVVNTKCATIARAVRQYAEENHIPYYNHYAVAGAADRQRSAGVIGRDGVHYSANGYRLWGNLLADALLKHLKR